MLDVHGEEQRGISELLVVEEVGRVVLEVRDVDVHLAMTPGETGFPDRIALCAHREERLIGRRRRFRSGQADSLEWRYMKEPPCVAVCGEARVRDTRRDAYAR